MANAFNDLIRQTGASEPERGAAPDGGYRWGSVDAGAGTGPAFVFERAPTDELMQVFDLDALGNAD